jgi:hypothetical protein
MIPPGPINDPGASFQRPFQDFTQRPDNPGQRAQESAAARSVDREQTDPTRTNEVRRTDRPADPAERADRADQRREVRTDRGERTDRAEQQREIRTEDIERERERIDQLTQGSLGIPSGTPEPGSLVNIVV